MQDSVYSPGAGHSPPILAGRDALLDRWQSILNDVVVDGRRRAEDTILIGPRGVGKTVTVGEFGVLAAARDFEVVNLQAVVGHAGLVEALLEHARRRIKAGAGPWQRARSALEQIGGVNLSLGPVGAGVTTRQDHRELAPVGAGTLASAFADLADAVRAERRYGGLLITVDELQVAADTDLALLAAALHRLNVDHPRAAVLFAGAGLAHTSEVLRGAGVTHPDRLFVIEPISPTLPTDDALFAIIEPASRAGVRWDVRGAERIVAITNGYPAHLQMFADAAWKVAPGPAVITLADVEAAIPLVAERLTTRTLGPRWERTSDRQAEFLAGLALLGGSAPISRVGAVLGRATKELSWLRAQLIDEGDIHAPRRGHVAMTVPLFAPFILRAYEEARAVGSVPMLSLDDMRERLGANAITQHPNG